MIEKPRQTPQGQGESRVIDSDVKLEVYTAFTQHNTIVFFMGILENSRVSGVFSIDFMTIQPQKILPLDLHIRPS